MVTTVGATVKSTIPHFPRSNMNLLPPTITMNLSLTPMHQPPTHNRGESRTRREGGQVLLSGVPTSCHTRRAQLERTICTRAPDTTPTTPISQSPYTFLLWEPTTTYQTSTYPPYLHISPVHAKYTKSTPPHPHPQVHTSTFPHKDLWSPQIYPTR